MRKKFTTMWNRPIIVLTLIGFAAVGCDSTPPVEDEPSPTAPPLATRFDPASCGSISGHVWWSGAVPNYPIINATIILPDWKTIVKQFANPNTIHITGDSKCV